MADGFRIAVKGVTDLQRDLARIDKSVDRATMWAVREAGRKTKQEARRNAPVLKGAGVSRKQAASGAGGPVRGLLRASIHSSKRLLRTGPGEYAVRVAPRGERVRFYSGKIEEKYGYMAKAHGTVAPQLEEIGARAWGRATKGRR